MGSKAYLFCCALIASLPPSPTCQERGATSVDSGFLRTLFNNHRPTLSCCFLCQGNPSPLFMANSHHRPPDPGGTPCRSLPPPPPATRGPLPLSHHPALLLLRKPRSPIRVLFAYYLLPYFSLSCRGRGSMSILSSCLQCEPSVCTRWVLSKDLMNE